MKIERHLFTSQTANRLAARRLAVEPLEQRQLLCIDCSFEPLPVFPTGRQPFDIVADDLDGDGDIDIVTANQCANEPGRCEVDTYSVSVLLNHGDGTFAREVRYDAAKLPQGVAVADFNGDGIKDLAVANSGANTVSVLQGKGDGTFQPTGEFPAGQSPRSIVAGDFDGDRGTDLIVTNMLTPNMPSDSVTVLLGRNDGTFNDPMVFSAGDEAAAITAGDMDEDGDLDVVTGNGSGTISVLINIGDGTFDEAIQHRTGTNVTLGVDIADVNGDSHPDVVASGSQVAVLLGLGDGEGTLASAVQYGTRSSGFFAYVAMDTGDLDGDGDADIAAMDFSRGRMLVLANDGEGRFEDESELTVGKYFWAMVLADFDMDGDLDVAAVNNGESNAFVLLNTTDQDEQLAAPARGDYNGDGSVDQADLDLVLLNWGVDAMPPPADWINNLPAGAIDQDDLDAVLLHWGMQSTATPPRAPAPLVGEVSGTKFAPTVDVSSESFKSPVESLNADMESPDLLFERLDA